MNASKIATLEAKYLETREFMQEQGAIGNVQTAERLLDRLDRIAAELDTETGTEWSPMHLLGRCGPLVSCSTCRPQWGG